MVELHVILKMLRCPHNEANKTHISTNFNYQHARRGAEHRQRVPDCVDC